MSHLGPKPVRGGSPPRESRTGAINIEITGVFAQEVARVLRVVVLLIFRIRKVEAVMIIYVKRAMRVSGGLNGIISIIHPRWAMEE